MEVSKAVRERRSVRKFKSDSVSEEDLNKILEAAKWAPSAGNAQPVELVILKDKDQKERLVKASLGQAFLAEAPVDIVVCANVPRTKKRYGKRGSEMYVYQDTAAAAENIHLMALALGYGTCWVGAFDDEAVADVIDAPEGIEPHVIIPMGKPAESPTPPRRRPLDEIVHKDGF